MVTISALMSMPVWAVLQTSRPKQPSKHIGASGWRRTRTSTPYNDLFCDLLEENAKAHPQYQGDCGDWLNWTVPDTDCNLPIFASGWGDGSYPVYFGYDEKDEVCGVYLQFIDIAESYDA